MGAPANDTQAPSPAPPVAPRGLVQALAEVIARDLRRNPPSLPRRAA